MAGRAAARAGAAVGLLLAGGPAGWRAVHGEQRAAANPGPELLVIGGAVGAASSAALRSVEARALRDADAQFQPHSTLQEARRGATAQCVVPASRNPWGARALVAGGFDGRAHLASTEVLTEAGWEEGPSLEQGRSCACSVVLNGKMYVMGGYDGLEPLAGVEVLDLAVGRWEPAPPLTVPRKNAAAVLWDDEILVIGGWDGRTTLRSTEVYDPRHREWRPGPSLSTPRECTSAALVGTGQQLQPIVIGGYNEEDVLLASTEVLAANGVWRPGPTLPDPPRECTAAVQDVDAEGRVRVTVVGGWDGFQALPHVEWWGDGVAAPAAAAPFARCSVPLTTARNRPCAVVVPRPEDPKP